MSSTAARYGGTVTRRADGSLAVTFDTPGAWAVELEGMVGLRVVVEIKAQRQRRSLSQNGYYWGVIIPFLCEATGYTAEEMHDALKWKFLRRVPDGDLGEGLATVGSTAGLSTKEFEIFTAAVREWASRDLECYIPEPNEPMCDLAAASPRKERPRIMLRPVRLFEDKEE